MQNYPEVILAPLEYYGAGNSKIKSFEKIKTFIFDEEKKIAKVNQKIYSQRKSADSPGSFGFERARRINK